MDTIPSSLICKRWTKSAKVDCLSIICTNDVDVDKQKAMMLREGALSGFCNRLVKLVGSDGNKFLEACADINRIISKFEKQNCVNRKEGNQCSIIGDPILVKTKGAPRKKNKYGKRKRCGNCRKTGHTIRKCPRFVSEDMLKPVAEELSSSGDDDSVLNVAKKGKNLMTGMDNNFQYGVYDKNEPGLIPTQCSVKTVNGNGANCVRGNVKVDDADGAVLPNGAVFPSRRAQLNTTFTSLLQNLHELGNNVGLPIMMHSKGIFRFAMNSMEYWFQWSTG
ncbi:hypothetical protein VNO77_33740 [Canavalia gladiata]|uniref:CCHC-type domain-containing protein n=1 Tax=Canavalia gladiata TaxID=3824 RepID=A0AAN9KG96_CANGL